jgi:hypothetical protein
MKHTPGPWEVIEHSWSETSIFYGKDKRIARLTIYDVAAENTQQSLKKEMDANARLIAAAPELLEALTGIIKDCDLDLPVWRVDEAREAISKAKGEL